MNLYRLAFANGFRITLAGLLIQIGGCATSAHDPVQRTKADSAVDAAWVDSSSPDRSLPDAHSVSDSAPADAQPDAARVDGSDPLTKLDGAADASVDARAADASVDARAADASVDARAADASVDARAADAGADPKVNECLQLVCGIGTVCVDNVGSAACVAAPNGPARLATAPVGDKIGWAQAGGAFDVRALPPIEAQLEPISGDFDNDMRADVAWYHRDNGTIHFWWGNSSRNFSPDAIRNVGVSMRVLAGNFDGIGGDDIFFYQPGSAVSDVVWWSNGNRTFSTATQQQAGAFVPFAGDDDGDGCDDIHWYDPGTGALQIWHGSSLRTFRGTAAIATGRVDQQPIMADFDGDGHDEMLWYPGANDAAAPISLSWSDAVRLPSVNGWTVRGLSYRAIAGDFDGDGRDDLFWNAPAGDQAYLWKGTGDRSAAQRWFRPTALTFANGGQPVSGDFDGDGRDDVLWYSRSRSCVGTACFSADRFAAEIARRGAAAADIVKFAFAVTLPNGTTRSAAGGAARRQADPPALTFTADMRFNPASVTKFVTAIALLKALQTQNINPDSAIGAYLPNDWTPHASILSLTFREVLSHRSGLRDTVGATTYAYFYADLKRLAADGVQAPKVYDYQNINYALARILVAYVSGYRPAANADRPSGTSAAFVNYVNSQVLQPSGVAITTFTPGGNPVLFYPIDAGVGTTYGNWNLREGTAGIQLSAREIAKVMSELFRGTLLNPLSLERMLDWEMGLRPSDVMRGKSYAKGGYFPGARNGGAELHSRVVRYPNGAAAFIVINGTASDELIDDAYHAAWY